MYLATLLACTVVCLGAAGNAYAQAADRLSRPGSRRDLSTMQKEMNEAAGAGFRFGAVMGGETSFGGSEVIVIMTGTAPATSRFEYRLLATNKTSTMQKEMQEAGNAGFEYRGQTVFQSTFGGKEVVVILERDRDAKATGGFEYD